jgi:hypothetical protein
MSAPTLERPPAPQPRSSAVRRRRPLILLVAACLVVMAAAVGTSLSLASRPARQPVVAVGAPEVPAPEQQPTDPIGNENTKPDQQPTAGDDTRRDDDIGPGEQAPVLADGTNHHVYISKVDRANNRITVDVVQRFLDGDAVKAAIADGKRPDEARYLTTWIRNQNPRLRTLPLAGDLQVKLWQSCEGPGNDRQAPLDRLAANARLGIHYYTLTVSDGAVQRITERLAINAC